jgi:type IV pilus assembly protein PilA
MPSKFRTTHDGFTMIEMLLVLSIVAVLALMVIPTFYPVKARGQINESLDIADQLKPNIVSQYQLTYSFPKSNEEAGLPEPGHLIGNFARSITLDKGALHIELGNKIIKPLDEKILTLRPITVIASPQSPISWICGYSAVPQGMQASGQNKTNIDRKFLPVKCR